MTTLLFLTLFLSSNCAAQFQYPPTNGEAMLSVIRRGNTLTINAADHENLPGAIQQDLLDFAAAVVALPHPVEETLVIFSHYGMQAAAAKFPNKNGVDDATPSGVWIWSDWRDAASVTYYPEFSRVRFYGTNRYVRLEHIEPTIPGRYIHHDYIVDMTDPTERWKYDGLALLRVAENGRWVGVAKDGQLFVGMLESGNEMSIVENRTPIVTPNPVAMGYSTDQETNLLLLPDGSYLVAELDQGVSGRQLLIMTGDGTQQIALLTGGLGNNHADGRDSFFGYIGEIGAETTYTYFTLTSTGQLQMVDLEGPNALSGWSDARAAGATPSGKFEMCQRDIPPFGAIQTLILRTPKANPAEPIPPFKSFDWRASDAAGLSRPVVSGHWIHWD